ncbi:ABC transporter ATP-binding protein [Nesterenkonia sandarakina]|uniref:Teichoic acid transport system ATP-binding protein n=1 Tax=Nesterenkonia sandarakina TaxID=272918 RepID=A0A2T0YSX3_9MICC|nr:ABC transporter ATP-binding protein [Nesterenkonia sandarakina]PRZ18898.1 teichoic acid transport system ATP-binding protein [Nesterenkonia sandarakina]
MSTSTPQAPRRNKNSDADLIAEDLAIEFDDRNGEPVDSWDDSPFTQQTPVVQPVDQKNICMVVDDASMTYRVRSGTDKHESSGRVSRVIKRITGSGWAEVPALSNLSFIVSRGESVGVIGTNGSGKSTLMKLLTGKVRPTSGEVYATSTPVMLGVNAALVKEISGRENIRLGCLAMGLSPEQTAAKYDQIVEISGLSDALEMPLKTYSSGMSSRLQFAIATSVDPDILLIDEALNTGDAQFRQRTKERLDEVRANAGAVFLVSHSLGTIKQMCTRVIWIEQGEMLADGDPQWVCSQYEEYTSHKSNGRKRAAQVVYERTRLQLDPVKIDFTSESRPKKAGSGRSR